MDFVIDTNIFLNVKNREDRYYEDSKTLLDSVDDGKHIALISTVVLAEICAGYYLAGEIKEKEEFLLHVLSSQNYRVVDVSVRIADEAALLRSKTSLKLPYAIVAATATTTKTNYVVTNDLDSFKKAAKYVKIATPLKFLEEITRPTR
jgi:predicted nucleic acid-binding protein